MTATQTSLMLCAQPWIVCWQHNMVGTNQKQYFPMHMHHALSSSFGAAIECNICPDLIDLLNSSGVPITTTCKHTCQLGPSLCQETCSCIFQQHPSTLQAHDFPTLQNTLSYMHACGCPKLQAQRCCLVRSNMPRRPSPAPTTG